MLRPTRTAQGLIALKSFRGIGNTIAMRIAHAFPELDNLLETDRRYIEEVAPAAVVDQLLDPDALDNAWGRAEYELGLARLYEVRLLSLFDEDYPQNLRDIPDPPSVLYVKGAMPNVKCVACVGTREPSYYGRAVADRITTRLTNEGWSVVSGLATGVDTICHEAALRSGGITVAVLANGLDTIYPASNEDLADAILAAGGALISEEAFGIKAEPRRLMQRNRIQSGLSLGTFVMQSNVKGGTMTTARFTIEQDRLLFAPVPRGPYAEETMAQGLLALTQLPPGELASVMGLSRANANSLIARVGPDGRAATGICGAEDYPAIFERLNRRLEKVLTSSAAPATPAMMSEREESLSL